MEITPIGIFRCPEKYAYDVPRQGILAEDNIGSIELNAGQNLEQSLIGLEGFSHIWLIFGFHHNRHWKPMVMPPRHRKQKIGVLASRAPYRPNFLGLSCVELVSVKGLVITVRAHDLLDGTPIYDIKPYLPYADSFPEASSGWTEEPDAVFYKIEFSPAAEKKLSWLDSSGVDGLAPFIRIHLENEPLNSRRNRLIGPVSSDRHILAYRTWRVQFQVQEPEKTVLVQDIFSGYTETDLQNPEDLYADKELHRIFNTLNF